MAKTDRYLLYTFTTPASVEWTAELSLHGQTGSLTFIVLVGTQFFAELSSSEKEAAQLAN